MKKKVVASISAIVLGTGLLFGVNALASETEESKGNEVKKQNVGVSALHRLSLNKLLLQDDSWR
ncbi:hypothetical protein KQI49_04885 [Virgibacillus sp. MSJ-26]|uniref:hypothetical protein n=1 Tax=Virgibacillus sp. MSJ-26 TaxID=2841522 RepID=UPI001C125918|nr:hypothetical protein [Virgibacillus sp. MSJ-26]MBU5466167.1 hypothetical protein [Virgibacillus sp. MSJ-26]